MENQKNENIDKMKFNIPIYQKSCPVYNLYWIN